MCPWLTVGPVCLWEWDVCVCGSGPCVSVTVGPVRLWEWASSAERRGLARPAQRRGGEAGALAERGSVSCSPPCVLLLVFSSLCSPPCVLLLVFSSLCSARETRRALLEPAVLIARVNGGDINM